MRFRRIEKDMGGMANVGLDNQHIQGKEDDVSTSDSKTYIGSNAKKKVAMNKIKNTKIGDDIHYYINGQEGRGIVVKMANEYLEIFKENGQLGTIHINDTFFVKDILVNKQWNDMDDQERYVALDKIHAPTPRFIMKAWEQLPEEIRVLLQKSNRRINKVGSTYEEGESKESETKDHARTGFAQNEQFSKKKPKPCKCGDPECKDPKCEKHAEVKKENVEKKYNKAGNREESQSEKDAKILGHKSKRRFKNPDQIYSAKEVKELNRKRRLAEHAAKFPASPQAKQLKEEKEKEEKDAKQKEQDDAAKKIDTQLGKHPTPGHAESKEDVKTPSSGSCPDCGKDHPGLVHEKKPEDKGDGTSGGFVQDEDDYKDKALYKSWLEFMTKPAPTGTGGTASNLPSERKEQTENEKNDHLQTRSGQSSDTRSATTISDIYANDTKHNAQQVRANIEARQGYEPKDAPRDMYKAETYEERSTQKAYEVWLERQAQSVNKVQLRYEEDERDSGKIEVEPDPDNPGKMMRKRKKKPAKKSGFVTKPEALPKGSKDPKGNLYENVDPEDKEKWLTPNEQKTWDKEEREFFEDADRMEEIGELEEHHKHPGAKKRKHKLTQEQARVERDRKATGSQPANPTKKSDVEHGVYGNVGGSDGVGVSTDTKVDMTVDSGYEERPHISVEEAGKLPRTTFNESGSELTVSGSQDSKDKPKFSQPADQEQPVRKAGLPQQHPNTYGMRYGMKGGVKKVWCPEHQMWEETRKDWHE